MNTKYIVLYNEETNSYKGSNFTIMQGITGDWILMEGDTVIDTDKYRNDLAERNSIQLTYL